MSDAGAIIEAVVDLGDPYALEPGQAYAIPTTRDGDVVFREANEGELSAPVRARGTTEAYNVDSFAHLWGKYSGTHSEVFGDPNRYDFTAVLDADSGGGGLAGFREHRIHMPLLKTEAWIQWETMHGKMVSQVDFAEFLEARIGDVVRPTGADMLELATTLEASSTVEFKSTVSLSSGARQFAYEEQQTARAGQTGQLEVPKDIELGIAPFEGGESFRVTARFRHRIRNGSLSLGVVLDNPQDVVRAAFDAFAESLGMACDTTVLLGTAPTPTLSTARR